LRGCAGNPPRRAGNFLLLAQKKVTKEEGLNRIRLDHLDKGLGRWASVVVIDRALYADKTDGCGWALSFGSFSLSQQRKGTRPPGRIPGAAQRAGTGVTL
jgi:hypothetical protein